MPNQKLAVSEIFHSVQGEGPSAGQLAAFLRLGLCNLKCVWCDTKYTWDWEHYDKQEEMVLMEPDEVLTSLSSLGYPTLLVVTGGEPLLQQIALSQLGLWAYMRIEVETNGTIIPRLLTSNRFYYNVSPKLFNSGNQKPTINPDAITYFVELGSHAIFKFVCQDLSDLEEVEEIQREFEIPSSRIWIMPEGMHKETLEWNAKKLASEVIERGWNLTSRMHIQIWGGKRGF